MPSFDTGDGADSYPVAIGCHREALPRKVAGIMGAGYRGLSREEVLRRLHFAVQDLAGGALGQGADKPDMAGILVGRHPFLAKAAVPRAWPLFPA